MRKTSPDYAWKETQIHNKIHQNLGKERRHRMQMNDDLREMARLRYG
jgi:hypothetical protein